ncbi:MAG: hypothetical protein NZO58_14840, partial [Gemmataceae bacterium]|nr:hypothetical protein [Gemmataceae bacterium]
MTWRGAFFSVTLSAFVWGSLPAAAQEYAIKFGRPGPGDQAQVKVENSFEVEFKLLDAAGQVVMDKKEV